MPFDSSSPATTFYSSTTIATSYLMASSASPAPSAAPSVSATTKTSADRRRAKADERLAAIVDTLENVKGEATARCFVDAVKAVWVRSAVASAASLPYFD